MFTKKDATLEDVFALCEEHNIEFVDTTFVDLQGGWRQVTMAMESFTPELCEAGIPFDGSSIPGFQTIVESDLTMKPDPSTAFVDPFTEHPTLHILCDVIDPLTNEAYKNDPRQVAAKALDFMRSEGIADEMFVGPEVEFFLFDNVNFGAGEEYAFHQVDTDAGSWNNETPYEGGNSGYRPKHQGGYFQAAPVDRYKDARSEIVRRLQGAGIVVERHHHEVSGAGQAEVNIRFDSMMRMADIVGKYKYIVRNVAEQYGFTATFMPKPLFGQNGSGMHAHQSLWKGGDTLFHDADGYAGLSELARYYVGGILKHAGAILAFGAPTTNSYKRLTPGYEAPTVKAYSRRNRSAAIRVPVYHADNPKAKRIEFRSGDPLANPYLFFSAMLMAGLDGIKNKIEPGQPRDEDLFEEGVKEVEFVPGSLAEALEALENDKDFLTAGGVFTEEFIANYVASKKEEADAVRLRPHPQEFVMYYNS